MTRDTPVDPVAGRILSFQEPDESDRRFAMRIGVPAQNVLNWKNLGVQPSLDSCKKLSEHNGWSLEYLLTGTGQRYQEGVGGPGGYAEGLRDAISAVLPTLHKLNEKARQMDGESVDFTEGAGG